jgi:hypothetical protein
VQWRYSDDYVGWAPIGPGRPGYAYGVPVNYDPPIAESWVFVQPRYLTSRAISHYALPIGGLSVAFFGATRVYRPQFRGGIVYNYGMPRDLVVKITRRPIYVQKVYRTNNWKGGRFDNNGPNRGIGIYAPRFSKDNRPNRGPKKFADNPNDFRPKAKLRDTFKGDVPKGWGPSAKGVKSIAKEDPDAFKRKHGFDGRDFGDRGKDKDRDRDNKGQAKGTEPPPIQKVIRDQGTIDDQGKHGDRNKGRDKDQAKGDGSPPPPKLPPPVLKSGTPDGTGPTDKVGATDGRGDRDDRGKDRDKNKQKNFGAPGGPGGADQFKQGNRDNSDQGGGGQRKQKDFGGGGPGGPGGSGGPSGGVKQFNQGGGQGGGQAQGDQGGGGGGDKKCQKHPEKPECQGRN